VDLIILDDDIVVLFLNLEMHAQSWLLCWFDGGSDFTALLPPFL